LPLDPQPAGDSAPANGNENPVVLTKVAISNRKAPHRAAPFSRQAMLTSEQLSGPAVAKGGLTFLEDCDGTPELILIGSAPNWHLLRPRRPGS